MGSEFAESLLLFYNWETQGCSKAGYELVLDELERKPQLEASYSQLSDKILGMSDFGKCRKSKFISHSPYKLNCF